jgi:hypothetical protein
VILEVIRVVLVGVRFAVPALFSRAFSWALVVSVLSQADWVVGNGSVRDAGDVQYYGD